MKKVLIAMDGSKESLFALKQYVEKIHDHDKHVTAVYCVHYSITDPEELIITAKDAEDVKAMMQKDEACITSVLDKVQTLLTENQVIGEVIRLEGKPEVAIISKAEEISASLIVMGSRGLGTIRRTILGSVSEFILHHSHIPVMICRMGCDSV
ncbi:stress response protein NhaX-like [Ostrea edulis]|uniref:stress response protein NhaX-like n=1 Tax=Ostrea edulis TaxID=37623 RepID=UPI0024AF9601|nr:stress response protein NhaX-like [Ostrea edulis]